MNLAIWFAFAWLHGLYDAVLYHMADYGRLPKGENPHGDAFWMRLIVAIGLADRTSLVAFGVSVVCYGLMFSFVHNGFYYEERRRLGVKYYHFFSKSSTSLAIFDFGPANRTIQFVIGLTIYLIYELN